jgi:hypothetical protein
VAKAFILMRTEIWPITKVQNKICDRWNLLGRPMSPRKCVLLLTAARCQQNDSGTCHLSGSAAENPNTLIWDVIV